MKIAEQEKNILAFWRDNEIFKKSLDKPSPKGDFVFYEGPPTANGRPGLHHILARAFKDVICRYKTMQGYRVLRKAGWDTHGLPVEIEVEKQIGISGKKDIEKFGIEAFNKKCRESVWKYQEEWEKLTERMGYWLDMKAPYITYSNEYIESVWSILKVAWDKELLYIGHKVVPHCPRCETSLSTHEVAQGYKRVTEPSVYIKFKVTKGAGAVQPGDYILSWTTTPWTLPGNVALAVNENITYVRVSVGSEYYVIAEALAAAVLGEPATVEAKIKGSELVGIEYEPLFPGAINPGDKKAWYVAAADFVTTTDGTGVVHTAVMYGADDYELGLTAGLPAVHTVDEQGMFLPSVTKWAGKFVKNKGVEQGIIGDLQERGLLVKVMDYEHDYPFCWRCDTPLLYYAKDSWFIKMTALKEDLLANAKTINWYPAHIKEGRFGEWLEGVKDWAISRERYWGTPLPIWKCTACGTYRCIGSLAALGVPLADVHRPYIDAVTLTCDCGGSMKRTPEVLDAWFDSGSMPLAQHHYLAENNQSADADVQYPADYIAEAIDQTRGWFYTLLAVSTILGKGASYKNVICLGHINDAKGKKMSKSKGNVLDPFEIMDRHGADMLRYYLFTMNQPGEAKSFDEKNLVEASRQVVMTLLNVLSFYELYAGAGVKVSTNSKDPMDRWIISLLHEKISSLSKGLDSYEITESTRSLGAFIQELSVWYIRRSRDRFKNESGQVAALETLQYILVNLSKLMAPSMPFVAEFLWKQTASKEAESVHLAPWPEYRKELHDVTLLNNMSLARTIVEKAHALRAEAGIKVRQPLARLEIDQKLDDELLKIIAEEVNVKEVVVGPALRLETALTEELKAEGTLRELTRQVNSLRKNLKLTPADIKEAHYYTDSIVLATVLEKFAAELQASTKTSRWTAAEDKDSLTGATALEVDGETIDIALR